MFVQGVGAIAFRAQAIQSRNPQGRGEAAVAGSTGRALLQVDAQLGSQPARLPEQLNHLLIAFQGRPLDASLDGKPTALDLGA